MKRVNLRFRGVSLVLFGILASFLPVPLWSAPRAELRQEQAEPSEDKGTKTANLTPTTLKLSAKALGDGWTGPTGIVVDSFDAAPPEGMKQAALDVMKMQMAPQGIRSVGDFTYRRSDNPLRQVTVRIFIFESEAKCQRWIDTKYRGPGAERRFKKLDADGNTLENAVRKQRICARGRVWMTCSTTQQNEDHLKFFDSYRSKIEKHLKLESLRSLAKKSQGEKEDSSCLGEEKEGQESDSTCCPWPILRYFIHSVQFTYFLKVVILLHCFSIVVRTSEDT